MTLSKKNLTPLQVSYNVEFSKYYEFVSQQPQWNMERRSVNMILRRLIGDDHFEW